MAVKPTNSKQAGNMKHKEIEDAQDNLEIGVVKTGRIKLYGDFNKIEEFRQKMKNAFLLRKEAQVIIKED